MEPIEEVVKALNPHLSSLTSCSYTLNPEGEGLFLNPQLFTLNQVEKEKVEPIEEVVKAAAPPRKEAAERVEADLVNSHPPYTLHPKPSTQNLQR